MLNTPDDQQQPQEGRIGRSGAVGLAATSVRSSSSNPQRGMQASRSRMSHATVDMTSDDGPDEAVEAYDEEYVPQDAAPEEDNKGPRCLSLRTVISIVSAILIVLVASVTLGVLVTSSIGALRDIGKGYSLSLLREVETKTVALFQRPADIVGSIDAFAAAHNHSWPSDDNSLIPVYLAQLAQAFELLGGRDGAGTLIYFWDNTRLAVAPFNNTHYYSNVLLPSPISAPGGLSNQTMSGYNTWYRYDNSAPPVVQPYPFVPGEEYRTLNSPVRTLLLTMTGNAYRTALAGYVVRSISDARGTFVEKYVPIAAPLHRRGDPRGVPSLFGVVVSSLTVDIVSSFLASSRATPNTEAFATDARGFLLGSSRPEPFMTERRVSAGTSAPLGCGTTDSVGSISTGPNTLVCRASRTAYGYAPLQELPDDVFAAEGAQVALYALAGETYYVASAEVPIPVPGFPLRLILIMPEKDVIGDVIKSRDTAVGIVAALVVLAVIVNYVSVLLLLRPLDGIAARMVKAANLDDDETDTSVSSMAEVAALQLAYYEMNDELNRIRSFVPQSVLMAKKNAADSEASVDEDDEDEDLAGSIEYAPASLGASAANHVSENIMAARSTRRGTVVGGGLRRMQSGASVRSTMSVRVAPGAKDKDGMNGLNLKPVTGSVLVANMCGFHQALAAHGRDEALARLAELVEFVYVTADGLGGVVASYHGDHFVLTFNAVKRCGEHAAAAARAGLALRDEAMAKGFGAALRVGVASGRLQVGNVGSKQVKAFSAMGPAFQHACVLERLSRLYSGADERGVLLPRRTCMDIQTRFRYRYVDVIALPGANATPIALLLHEISNEAKDDKKQPEDDEWLYVVGCDADDDKFAHWNRAFELVAAAKVLDAREAMETHMSNTGALAASRRSAAHPASPASRSESPQSQGPAPSFGASLSASVTDIPTSGSPLSKRASMVPQDPAISRFNALCAAVQQAEHKQPAAGTDLGAFYTVGFLGSRWA